MASTAPLSTTTPPHRTSTLTQRSLPALDGLRGIVSLVIVLGHILTYFIPYNIDALTRQPLSSVVGLEYNSVVSLFLVLSGYTLTYTYNRPGALDENQGTWTLVRTFFYKRWLRLAPMYYFGLFLSGIDYVYLLHFPIYMLIPTAVLTPLMAQSLVPSLANYWDGPVWTVSALAVCYLFFPILLKKIQHKTVPEIQRISIGCLMVSIIVPQILLIVVPQLSLAIHIFAFFRLPQFIVGMCAALLRSLEPPVHPLRLVGISSTILFLNFIGSLIAVGLTAPNVGMQEGWSVTVQWYLPHVYAMLLVGLSAPDNVGGIIQRILSSRPAVLLGNWSYALYCLHFPLLIWLGFAVKGKGISIDAMPLVWDSAFVPFPIWSLPLLLIYTVFISALAHHYIEIPCSRYISRRTVMVTKTNETSSLPTATKSTVTISTTTTTLS